ncbi:MAG: cystathionine gamma-synthase [Planctomycetota bacterium]|jgi:cystathionine gamma-synthase
MKSRVQTILAAAGCEPDEHTGALSPPIHMATTFERDADGGYGRGFVYGRLENPTRTLLEKTMTELEGGAAAAAFSTGMAAASTVLMALDPGDHVLIANDVYHGVRTVLREILTRWKLDWSDVDQTNLDAVRAAMRPNTRLLWAESPSNPMARIVDINALVEVAEDAGAKLIVDCTWVPFLQHPLDLGADLVLHSSTKYLSGHSDAMGGILVSRDENEFMGRIRQLQREVGAIADPFSSWLTLRGMRSLAWRMRGHCENAAAIAVFLEQHEGVAQVHHPSLKSHPGHELATRQMSDFGGMMSFEVNGSEADAIAVAAGVKLFIRATSLGGTESLIEHRRSIEGPYSRTPAELLRLSVGLEHVEDLIEDLARALAVLRA